MKVAVTGASGFIGKHVLAELNARGAEITAVVRPGGNHPADLLVDNLVQLDIHEAGPDAYARLGCPDFVLHLGWGGLPHYNSLHHFEQELPGHYRFLRHLVEAGLPALTVAGTCFEYGMQSGKLSESLMALPTNPYGYAKDALRRQLAFLQKQRSFRLTWGRLFYLYGPGQSANSLLSQLKLAVDRGEKRFNMSAGEQLRDYLPVEKAAEFLVALALSEKDIGLVNVCAGQPVSVRRLVEEWILENGWDIELNLGYYPYPNYEPMAFWGDAGKLNSILEAR